MAARYVNPDNITAQGQYFYTGLPPGSYDVGRAGGGANVYGAGSGGSAGVSPDYTGADAGKSWNYPTSFEIKLPVWDKDHGLGDGGGTQGPQGPPGTPGTPTPVTPVSPGRRRMPARARHPMRQRTPALVGGPPALPALSGPDPMEALPSAERPQIAMNSQGENPAQGDRPMLALPQYSEPTRARMDRRNTADRARRASMMPAKDFAFGMEALASSEGTQGMWGAFSASRSHSRPRTF